MITTKSVILQQTSLDVAILLLNVTEFKALQYLNLQENCKVSNVSKVRKVTRPNDMQST